MERYVAPAATKRDAIGAIYAAVQAPQWAAPNLDGLIDVLRDLSWLPPGPVVLHRPEPGRLPWRKRLPRPTGRSPSNTRGPRDDGVPEMCARAGRCSSCASRC
jgi:hypothetical protein